MTASLLLRCGCVMRFHDGETPVCASHGVQAVVRTVGMPAPRIRGVATGPHVEPADLGAWSGRLTGSDPGVKDS